MAKALNSEQVIFYQDNGFLSPCDGIEPSEANSMLEDLDVLQSERGISAGKLQIKGHLCFRRSYDLTFNHKILDVVEDLIGPNILVFASRFWIKRGLDNTFVSWHQDSAYFGLDPNELVTVWLSLTDATTEMGCMKVIPGSHRGKTYHHEETFEEKNLLARGQVIQNVNDESAAYMPLKAGQFSCHHERIVHGSDPNRTSDDRVGLGIFYIPTHVRSTIGRRTAYLVRGNDDYGHWDPDPVPKGRYDINLISHIEAASDRYVDPQYVQEAGA